MSIHTFLKVASDSTEPTESVELGLSPHIADDVEVSEMPLMLNVDHSARCESSSSTSRSTRGVVILLSNVFLLLAGLAAWHYFNFSFLGVPKTPQAALTPGEATALDVQDLLNQWELTRTIPNSTALVEQAMRLDKPDLLRKLEKKAKKDGKKKYTPLVYADAPADLPAIRTQCVIDTVQSAAYLGQSVTQLYRAINSANGGQCPDNTPEGCAVSVAGFVTSMFWLGSYLALASSSCAQSLNTESVCAADFLAMAADAGEIATAGAAVKGDCDFSDDTPWWKKLGLETTTPKASADRRRGKVRKSSLVGLAYDSMDRGSGKVLSLQGMSKRAEIKRLENLELDRRFDQSICAFDVTNAASYIVRAALQIRSAARACSDPKNCAVNVLNIISSFAWVVQFLGLAVSDCMDGSDQRALCGADIADLIAGVTNFCAAGTASIDDCAHPANPLVVDSHEGD
eukprot:TRINITY_DN22549_c0_g1_i1.p1 TRINITY_DN22549_c0_g1~~TRINITY_DN22549_c0_g1_i1.p1  ORF type:complete len:490 (-),score=54.73 TRINITY_DN22549_c0_g1_i1:99-1469(-)